TVGALVGTATYGRRLTVGPRPHEGPQPAVEGLQLVEADEVGPAPHHLRRRVGRQNLRRVGHRLEPGTLFVPAAEHAARGHAAAVPGAVGASIGRRVAALVPGRAAGEDPSVPAGRAADAADVDVRALADRVLAVAVTHRHPVAVRRG